MANETTTLDGAQIGYNRTGRRTDADACPLRRTKGVAGRRCCRKHTGVPRNSASLLRTLHRKAMEKRKEREASRIDPTALRPLCPRYPLLLPRSPPFIGREGAVVSALFPVPFGQGSALIFAHPSHYIRRLVQLLGSRARPKDCSCGLRLELC
mgnify:CR=1 FL=1